MSLENGTSVENAAMNGNAAINGTTAMNGNGQVTNLLATVNRAAAFGAAQTQRGRLSRALLAWRLRWTRPEAVASSA